MLQEFMTNIYHQKKKKIVLMMTGVFFFPKTVRRIYNSKYQLNYSNQYYVIKNDYIKDKRIRWTYSGKKQMETGYVYLNGSPYCDIEVLSQLRSCLHDTIINSTPIIGGGGLTNLNCIDSVHLEG